MTESKEHNSARLANLKAIEPLLGSLRVLSLSSMQMALNRQEALESYAERFRLVAAQLAQVADARKAKKGKAQEVEEDPNAREWVSGKSILVILGSTRGIIGQFNRRLSKQARELQAGPGRFDEIWAFGRRVQNTLKQEGVAFVEKDSLSAGSTPQYSSVSEILREWLAGLESGGISRVAILSFRKWGKGGSYQPRLTRLLPESLSTSVALPGGELPWPEPIVEGDPAAMLARIREHLSAILLYEVILDSVAAENLYRYRLLEEAKENTSKLLEELAQAIQIERRKEITQQLQEILAGSGMLMQR